MQLNIVRTGNRATVASVSWQVVPSGPNAIDLDDIDGDQIQVRGGGRAMAGDYAFGDNPVDAFYRKYGDTNGNRLVDRLDFGEFRGTFGLTDPNAGYRDELDFDDDDTIGLFDFAAFRRNFAT